MIVKVIVLLGLTRLVVATHQPFLCSGIYTAFGLVMDLMMPSGGHVHFAAVALWAVLRFALASVYFGLLSRFDRGLLHFAILLGGFALGVV